MRYDCYFLENYRFTIKGRIVKPKLKAWKIVAKVLGYDIVWVADWLSKGFYQPPKWMINLAKEKRLKMERAILFEVKKP